MAALVCIKELAGAVALAALLATTLASCMSSQRFAAPARQPQAVQQVPQAPSGPYTREREDREFGQPAK
jgi:hypothetical protein